ncbi:TrkA C-terminal domain-containing protein [Cohnella candidum]|nr:TrkA C-terminal domain-containing protein [Cohnella candidum]
MGFILNYFLIVFLVIEIAVVLMRSTGLDHDVSRFQVVSLMTSTGFTTKESELILGHPVRRRIGIFLILFGVFSFAVIISSISSILVPDFKVTHLAEISAGLALLLAIVRVPAVRRILAAKFDKPLEDTFEIEELPIEVVLLQNEGDWFVDIPVGERSGLVGQTIVERCEANSDINLLFIKRGTLQIRRERAATRLEAGDVLYLYGDREEIGRVFRQELQDRVRLRKHDLESKSLV